MTDTQYVLSFDGGKSSGIALGSYSDTQPYTLVKAWQITGAPASLKTWLREHWSSDTWNQRYDEPWSPGLYSWTVGVDDRLETDDTEFDRANLTVISEKFVPVPGGGFSQGLDSTLPLVCEGVLIGLGLMPDYTPGEKRWRRATEQYFAGGTGKPQKRKRAKQFLRDTDNYVMPKALGQPDNEDAVSAILHGVNYTAKVLRNKPTYDLISDWLERNPV